MTAQVPEKMVYEGVRLPLLCEPDLPVGDPRLEVEPDDVDGVVRCLSTDCWRDYVAEWSVRRGLLYFVAIEGKYRLKPGPIIPATWYSGILRMATGGVKSYVHGGYDSQYESEFFVEVDKGVVVKTWNNPE